VQVLAPFGQINAFGEKKKKLGSEEKKKCPPCKKAWLWPVKITALDCT
jgi:hypothetical protein